MNAQNLRLSTLGMLDVIGENFQILFYSLKALAYVCMKNFDTIMLLFIGSIIGSSILYGYQKVFLINPTRIWEASLDDLTRKAENQFHTGGCVDYHLHQEMEKYATMSDHGFWCGVVAEDASSFNRALGYSVCTLRN